MHNEELFAKHLQEICPISDRVAHEQLSFSTNALQAAFNAALAIGRKHGLEEAAELAYATNAYKAIRQRIEVEQ